MKSLSLLLRAFWFLSIIVFLVVLFYAYFYWQDFVDINFDKDGYSVYHLTRNVTFYSIAGFVLIINLLFIIIRNILPRIEDSLTFLPHAGYWLQNKYSKQYAVGILKNWINSFLFFINIYVSAFTGMLAFVNLADYDARKELSDFTWMLPLLAIGLSLHVLYLAVRFFIKTGDFSLK